MGNCQAVDTATLVIQHPCGKVEKFYTQITAGEIMKKNPGHYVALLITTTLYHPSTENPHNTKNSNSKSEESKTKNSNSNSNNSLRVTRVKLLRPAEILALGHVYRLISSQEVMKGLVAKKQAKLKKSGIELADKEDAFKDLEKAVKRYQLDKNHEVTKHERQRSRTVGATNGSTAKPRTWQPSLKSISEGGS